MWKNINKILHDKNDYHLDPLLKNDVEVCDMLFQTTINYEKSLLKRKIIYFFKYDKLFLVRLVAKYLLKSLAFLIFIGVVLVTLALAFNININFKKIERGPPLTIYIPSAGDIEQDSLNIVNYRKEIGNKTNITYVIFYPKDPSKDYNLWKKNLAGIEAGMIENQYEARREGSQYWGKYQMGESARKSVGLQNINWETWKSNPELQEASLRLWVDYLYKVLEDDIKKFDGKFLSGWSITESGIIAMAHNVGAGPTRDFLYSSGKNIPKDGSGKDATRFLILGNYDLEIKK